MNECVGLQWRIHGGQIRPWPPIEVGNGAVHKVRHAIFGQFLPPSPCHTSSHIPGPPKYVTHLGPPRFLEGLVQKPRTKAPCTNSASIVRGSFCPGVCQGVFCLEDFVWGGFCPLPFCQNTSVTSES